MKAKDIRDMRKDELGKKLDELHSQLFALRTQSVTEKVENVKAVSNMKKDIARIKTVMKELELSQE